MAGFGRCCLSDRLSARCRFVQVRRARSHSTCVTFTGFGIFIFFREASGLHMLSLLTGQAESSPGALRHRGFGLSASTQGFHSHRLPSRLTSRSSRRCVVASLKLTGMRAILATIRRVRRGLTPALGPKERFLRVHFDLKDLEPFTFRVDGVDYGISLLNPLAQKMRIPTNVSEYVYKLPTGKYVYLTVVGDEDQTSAYGIARGWYVAEVLPEKDATWLIQALEPFTRMYK